MKQESNDLAKIAIISMQLTASHLFAKHLLAHRTGLGADAAVVTTVKFMEMGLFVAIAGPSIQYNIPFHTRIPAAPFKRLRRARFNAFGTFTKQAFFNGHGRC